MNWARFVTLFRMEFLRTIRRPSFLILVLLVLLLSWGIGQGNVRMGSGDSSVGGAKAFITSEHHVTYVISIIIAVVYLFFLSIAAGMAIPDDEELNIGPLLHATSLRTGEYIWGKFWAVCFAYSGVLALQFVCSMFLLHVIPTWANPEIIGPFAWANYLRPFFWFGLPTLLFFAGLAFATGEFTRKPILVYLLPITFFLSAISFLFTWAPEWLDPRIDQLLMLIDPTGFRWFNQTWLKVDRGVEYYNYQPIAFDGLFYANRLIYVILGLLLVSLSHWHFKRTLRGNRGQKVKAFATSAPAPSVVHKPLPAFDAVRKPLGFFSGVFQVTRFELRELAFQPGLYLFVPLILLQVVGETLAEVGFLETQWLHTPGTLAVGMMGRMTLLVCLLLLFYSVESLERERATRLSAVLYATPVQTASLLLGKIFALSSVALVVLVTGFLAAWLVLIVEQQIPMELFPFVLVWGFLLIPTFLVWTSFALLVHALCRHRYATYAVTLGTLVWFGWLHLQSRLTWLTNWMLWESVPWTDMGTFEFDRQALILNRVFVLGLTLLFVVVALRFYRRRETDPVQLLSRFRLSHVVWETIRLLPAAAVPLVAGILLWHQIGIGMGGTVVKQKHKDYWKQNVATWSDPPQPELKNVDLDLEFEPAQSWFRVRGTYQLVSREDKPIQKFPVTTGVHWENLQWTLEGKEISPEDCSGLYVFTLPAPLKKGETVSLGFEFQGRYPFGVTKNGGGADEFILPSGVLLNSFGTSFLPLVGFVPSVGVDKDNSYEPQQRGEDFYLEDVEPLFGPTAPFSTKIRITGPDQYVYNSVGTLVSDEVKDGRRTVVWQSDQPVRAFNVVAGRWESRSDEGVTLYFHPEHRYNAEEMVLGLKSARKYYSQWFGDFPWKELKLSEFPGLAGYAQGFATNVVFSEAGFLAKNETTGNAAFIITAHECAHQWWGNMLSPGDGPGGNILSEGMANYSTILLIEQVKGLAQRIEFCKKIEDQYAKGRSFDAEWPLVRIIGSQSGDMTVTYDKGAWVFWMLQQHLGRERMLEGLRLFIEKYRHGPDYPLLQDFLAVLRPLAADPEAFDRFTRPWFFEVVFPQYRLSEVQKTRVGDHWEVTFRIQNAGTGRMPIEVAAACGERFAGEREEEVTQSTYNEVRTSVELGADETQQVTLKIPFDPEYVIVDPDALVLQLFRKQAIHRF